MDVLTIPDLANACEMAAEDPDLKIVSRRDVLNLSVNDWAKLSHAGERFKVKVEEINGTEFVGSVRSDLVFDHPFKFGDHIIFYPDNVFDVYGWASIETKMANEVYKKADKG